MHVFHTEDCRGRRQAFASCNTDIRHRRKHLLDNESSNDEGCVVVYRLLLQGVEVDFEVDVDNLSTRRCTESRWDSLDGMTGGGSCLVALSTYVLHANDGVIEAAVVSMFRHNIRHVDAG